MTPIEVNSRPLTRRSHWRLIRNVLVGVVAFVVVTAAALVWYVHTDSFQRMVRARLVSALENMTGGRAEVAKLGIVPFRFRVEAHDLTIHGTEPATEVPYAHVDRLTAEIKIISIFRRDYGFHALLLDHPVVHIIVHPDGSTNQPSPRVPNMAETSPIKRLFDISIGHLQVTHGELLWDNERIPLQFSANDVFAEVNYSLLHLNYEALLRLQKVDAKFRDLPPLTSKVAARLAVGQNYINVNSFEWYSGKSRLEASGRLEDFQRPKFNGNYNGRFDVSELAPIAGVPHLRTGTVETGGRGSWTAQDFYMSGKAAFNNLDWRDRTVFLRNASGTANYALSSSALKISDIQARVLGGSVTGNLDAVNWFNTRLPTGESRVADEQRGSLTLQLKDVSIAALVSALQTRRSLLARFPFAGSLSAIVNTRWTGSVHRSETSFNLSAAPSLQFRPGEIPLAGNASGVYRARTDELELANLNLVSRTTQVQATGRLSTSAMLRISVATSDLHEWHPILASLDVRLPVTLHGRATFNGNASGTLSDFAIRGHLQANNFDSLLATSARSSAPPVHWDSLAADVHASPYAISARNGILARGPEVIRFDGSVQLRDGEFANDSPITAHVWVRSAEVADLQALAGFTYPVSGLVSLSLTASGTRTDPHGDGRIDLVNGTFYEQPVTHLTSDLHFGGHEVQLNNAVVSYRDGQIGGGAAYNWQTRGLHFNLNGANFDLVHFSKIQAGKIKIAGKLDFTATGDGALDAPIVNANIRLRNLSFDNERAGDFNFEAVTHGSDMQLIGRSHFENAQLAIDGSVHLRDDWPAQLALRFDAFDVDSVLRPYIGDHLTSHVPAAGSLQLSGPLLHPERLTATADLTSFSASMESFAIHNEGPIHFTVQNRVLALDRLRLVGDGTDITAQGTAQLAGEHDVDIRADGRLNLRLIEGLTPGLFGSGLASVAIKVTGTYSAPLLAGKLDISNGSVSYIDLPNGLSEMNGTLVFNQDRLQIQTLNARVGGGNVSLSGFMSYSPHLAFNITATGRDVRLRPAGISATSDAELHLTGTPRDALLSGDVTILKLTLTPGFDFARYLEGVRQTTTLPQGGSLLNNLRLDLHLVTTPELQMEAAAAKVSGDADLHLRGTLPRPVLLGRIDILEGDVYFSGTKYRLERGEITFTGPTGIKPALDLEATTRVRDYDITLGVNGTPDKLNMTYRSEPPLPSADIVALLALGHTESQSSLADTSSQSVSQQASTAILSQALNATLSSRSQRLFGITRIKVDPNGLNTETTPTRAAPAVTLEQQVSSNLTVTYSTETSQTSQQVIQAEYNVTRNISIVAVRDQNGVVSFDVLLRHRRK
ncbi:MAG TPA: translocation/assembly module TamB [Terriglobales bacterium]|nr:translocation/assembly module TamB [Terriglobales bacterium]